ALTADLRCSRLHSHVRYKRLEDGKFCWPGITDGVVRLTAAQLQALLEGLDWRRVHETREMRVPTTAS
ncbi:IS66 family insertion sequence element accessory protein TnpB, partial [Mesorhizobium sp.]|uniref:IS66 family insertion sequence element accessory protein TnpB n=1 Tax=Mesorhizobium sp. TaxID=1871066 RepID=UPI000FE794DF